MLRIANAAGFLGDRLDAPRRLVESADVDYLTLEYLAELTMSILARAREKDPSKGYAMDFVEVARSLLPALGGQPRLRVVTNAGGVNPQACAAAVARVLKSEQQSQTPIGVVAGDDLLPLVEQLRLGGCDFVNSDTGQRLDELRCPLVAANAYLGAGPIAEALAQGARIVITGRVADASLTLAPAVHEFGWSWDDWDRLAAATVAGHLIECGAQVTGGYSAHWRDCDLTDVGYPIAELSEDGQAVITKAAGSGGVVDRQTVVEQLVYEITDPRAYETPDVVADFTSVTVEAAAADRVLVRGATGRPAPDSYKVSMAYHAGYTASSQLLVYGPDCVAKAQHCGQLILARLERAGYTFARTLIETLGTGAGVPRVGSRPQRFTPTEVVLRVSVQDENQEAVQRFVKEVAPLITSGPSGLAGYAAGRSGVRSVLAFWPTLVPKQLVEPAVEVRTAADWAGWEPNQNTK